MFTLVYLVKVWFIFSVSPFGEASHKPSIHWDPRNPLWVLLFLFWSCFGSPRVHQYGQLRPDGNMKTAMTLCCSQEQHLCWRTHLCTYVSAERWYTCWANWNLVTTVQDVVHTDSIFRSMYCSLVIGIKPGLMYGWKYFKLTVHNWGLFSRRTANIYPWIYKSHCYDLLARWIMSITVKRREEYIFYRV